MSWLVRVLVNSMTIKTKTAGKYYGNFEYVFIPIASFEKF